jgi:hypothetical protein
VLSKRDPNKINFIKAVPGIMVPQSEKVTPAFFERFGYQPSR